MRANPICPLCGQTNACAMERERSTGQPQAPCWCLDVTFGAELLQRVPAAARGLACVCRCCAGAAAPRTCSELPCVKENHHAHLPR